MSAKAKRKQMINKQSVAMTLVENLRHNEARLSLARDATTRGKLPQSETGSTSNIALERYGQHRSSSLITIMKTRN
jgi:hypothetical protein